MYPKEIKDLYYSPNISIIKKKLKHPNLTLQQREKGKWRAKKYRKAFRQYFDRYGRRKVKNDQIFR